MPCDLTVKILSRKNIDMVKAPHFQIRYPAAMRTDKVIMRRSVRVKPFRPRTGGNFLDLAELGEQGEIPINRPKADAGIFLTDILIYGLCGRMIAPACEKIPNGFPLSAVIWHGKYPFINIGMIINFIISAKRRYLNTIIKIPDPHIIQ